MSIYVVHLTRLSDRLLSSNVRSVTMCRGNAITTAISAWNWGLAASTIARALGPAFVGGFGKALGGPAVIAAALAVAAGPALSLFNLGEVQCVRRIYLH